MNICWNEVGQVIVGAHVKIHLCLKRTNKVLKDRCPFWKSFERQLDRVLFRKCWQISPSKQRGRDLPLCYALSWYSVEWRNQRCWITVASRRRRVFSFIYRKWYSIRTPKWINDLKIKGTKLYRKIDRDYIFMKDCLQPYSSYYEATKCKTSCVWTPWGWCYMADTTLLITAPNHDEPIH